MHGAAGTAVKRTIDIMWSRYPEPLCLEELAGAALFSKFYYSRVFRNLTGTSPGRFLSAVRLFMAKRHLLDTRSSVTEISYDVGYNSLGTFTSRFTRSVGISPARYRFLADYGMPPITPFGQQGCPAGGQATLSGLLTVPTGYGPVRIYVGAFNSPIVEGQPQSCDVLNGSGRFRLSVPDGDWFIRAAAVPADAMKHTPLPGSRIRTPPLIGMSRPMQVSGGRGHTTLDLQLRRFGAFDLPILLALPELDGGGRAALMQAAT
ncbi:AraC family transcriptional regulator [Streptomyces sp. NPDC047002]|uniref:helix-turn-helix transcriptional regulator n=1 Tax=Streptomyces sp. NPDC047002 TaxID=3155475 RepID=UPI0034528CC6